MREFELHTKDMSKGIHAITGDYGRVRVFIHENCMSTGESYLLENFHYEKLASYKSVSALIKYAKANEFIPANQITDSASDAHSGSDSASVTSCPAPAPAPAKSAAKGQGILFVEVETVGRGKDAEIIEISVVDSAETVLFHSRVSPSKPYKDVAMSSPTFAEIWKPLSNAIGRADIAFYNSDHSKRMILQSIAKAFDTPTPEHFYTLFPHNKVICVCERYKEFNNYRLGYFRNYGLQHINSACGQSGLFWRDVSNSASGNAIKSARLFSYLDHKAVA